MQFNTFLSLIPIIFAGLMNASFVIPARYTKNFIQEKIWLYHSIIGLVIIPWLLLYTIFPGAFHDYLYLQPKTLLFLTFSGIIFGIGQVCFANAIGLIGIALSFSINLCIGVTVGSLFVVFYKTDFFTDRGFWIISAVFLIVCGLVSYYLAGKSDINSEDKQSSKHYHSGWILASCAGLASGLQNIAFVMIAFYSKNLFQTNNSFWVWPPFLFAAAIPMFLGFRYRIQANSKAFEKLPFSLGDFSRSIVMIFIMGLFFTGSLALYSLGMEQLTSEQQMIGWPLFMVSIVLTSQYWGWFYEKTNMITSRSKVFRTISIILLIIAIIFLAIAK